MNALLLAPVLLAALASAEITVTATILLPDMCVTQSIPKVTVLASQNSLTTYSYGCADDPFATTGLLWKSMFPVGILSSLLNKSPVPTDLLNFPTNIPNLPNFPTNIPNLPSFPTSLPSIPTDLPSIPFKRGTSNNRRLNIEDNDSACLGSYRPDVCIPWEITQGASYWAVHFTATNIGGFEQECTFGPGGVTSGSATCTASANLGTSLLGVGEAKQTRTYAKNDVDNLFVRDSVSVTVGGPSATTGVFAPKTTGSAGIAVPKSVPTGMVAMVAGAGGILAAALAL